MLINTKALVLKSVPFKESDLIVTLFTERLGKTTVLVKGAKKMKSRLSHSIQVFTIGHYTFYKKNNNLPILRQGDVVLAHKNPSLNFGILSASYYVCEFINFFMPENEPNPKFFNLAAKTMHLLTSRSKEALLILAGFKIKSMALMGYAPCLTECVLCGQSKDDYIFSISQGGLVCDGCLPHKNKFITKRQRFLMLLLLRTTFEEILKADIQEKEIKQMNIIFNKYIQYYSDGHIFKSEQVFQKI
ncbi:DNA repair protein RecO [Proteinivorax tanatarense]|uniref:DNA repair protein RecO n=1 Tax=Proteinivorax tanatarense TaxID=1260629 RepID=A0AAU7VHS6_9FIRM